MTKVRIYDWNCILTFKIICQELSSVDPDALILKKVVHVYIHMCDVWQK